jgi:hypothetical protein
MNNEPDPRVIKLVRELEEARKRLGIAERRVAIYQGLLRREKALRAGKAPPPNIRQRRPAQAAQEQRPG